MFLLFVFWYQKLSKQRGAKRGLLFFQKQSVTKEQMEHIKTSNSNTQPKFVFSDNDIDSARSGDAIRKYKHGIISEYDQLFGYGIVTTFYNKTRPGFTDFKQLMDTQFEWLQQHSNHARMTGSGSSLFSVFDNLEEASKIAALCDPRWQTFVARGVNQSRLHKKLGYTAIESKA